MSRIPRVPIQEVVDGLLAIPEREFTNERVARYLDRRLVALDSLQRFIHFSSEIYTRNLIFKNQLFEVLLICWEAGQASPIHNHSRQHCWLSIQEGMLSLTNYHEKCLDGADPSAGSNSIRRIALAEVSRTDHAGAGTLSHVDDLTYIHKIENCSSHGQRSISLHVYSKPFDTCDIYDLHEQTARPINLGYYTIDGHRVEQSKVSASES